MFVIKLNVLYKTNLAVAGAIRGSSMEKLYQEVQDDISENRLFMKLM